MSEQPKYSIGTIIRLRGQPASQVVGASEFAIVARHFLDTAEPHYRIRSLADRHERTVREEDIVTSADAMSGETGANSKIVPFRLRRLSIVL